MSGPAWLSEALAAVMIAVALFHAARLARLRRRSTHPDIDLTHLAMGVAMALMLVATLSARSSLGWALAFAVPTVWFTWRSMQTFVFDGAKALTRHLPHALACGAMVYVLLVLSSAGPASADSTAMPGMQMAPSAMPGLNGSSGTAQWSFLAVPLMIVMCGVAALNAAQLRRATASGNHIPAVTNGCQLAMSTTMIYMLVMVL